MSQDDAPKKSPQRKYYEKNIEAVKQRRAARSKEDKRRYQKIYRGKNRTRIAADAVERRRSILQATPKWLSRLDKLLIEQTRLRAALITEQTGVRHEVDHIVPLKGDTVCGLHVPWNLQIITAEENYAKGNKLLDMG